MCIGLTYLEKWDGPPRNAVSLIDRSGQIVLTYAKVHTCDFFAMESCCTPGDGFPVCTLDTGVGPVQVGAMICHDREQPESARVLMLRGAEVILTPNACTLQDRQIDQFRARAFENALAVAMTNYAAPHTDCNGRSVAYDAEADLIVMAGKGEGIYIAPIDLGKLRHYRTTTFWGNAYRRPRRYGLVTSMEVEAPFKHRLNGLGEPFDRSQR
jgi:predicted amidohydrolase